MTAFTKPAPAAWGDYLAGRPTPAETVPNLVGWLSLLDQTDDAATLLNALGSTGSQSLWQYIEREALEGGQRNSTRAQRLDQLRASLNEDVTQLDPDKASWEDCVSLGRLNTLIADIALKEKQNGVFQEVEGRIDAARLWFEQVEGGEFFAATAEIIRGKNRAWRNDIAGATASLSFAIGVFREVGHPLREAEAAYELAMANIDVGNGQAAASLLNTSIKVHRAAPDRTLALARALQARARASLTQLAKAVAVPSNRSAHVEALITEVEQFAGEAYLLTSSSSRTDTLLSAIDRASLASQSDVNQPDTFRAAMAARDLCELNILRHRLAADETRQPTELAQKWFRAACTEAGYAWIFERGGTATLRAALDAKETPDFTLHRLSQLEYDLLAISAPETAAPLLIEIGKRFQLQDELNYTIECYLSAVAAFRKAAETAGEEQDFFETEAEHWLYRGQKLAAQIGYDLEGSNLGLSALPDALRDRAVAAAKAANASILRLNWSDDHGLSLDIRSHGRVADRDLIVASPELASALDLQALMALSDRGDIPLISHAFALEDGAQVLVIDRPSGVTLSTALAQPSGAMSRERLASRLCRTVAGLIRAHANEGAMHGPLYLSPENVLIVPGDRLAVAKYGPLYGRHAPPLGWPSLYAAPKTLKKHAKGAIDAIATARMIKMLFDQDAATDRNWLTSSFLRRAFLLPKEDIDALPLDLVRMLDKLAKGDVEKPGKNENADDVRASALPVGYSDLMKLARAFDLAASAQ